MGRAVIAFTAVSLALVAAMGVTVMAYQGELTARRNEVGFGGFLLPTAAGPIEYAERGVGTPLLSIHGAGGGYDQGLTIVADLVGEGFRVIAPSRFGYLGTPIPSDASTAAQADAHAALLDALAVDKAVVVGTSAGARSAVEFAIRHPRHVAALVLLVPGTYAPTSPVMIEGSRGSAVAFWLVNNGADFAWWAMEKVATSTLIRFMGVPPDVVAAAPQPERDRVMQLVRSVEPLSRRVAGINIDSHPDQSRPRFEDISAPTLVVSARDDLFNTLPAAQFAARTIPNARLVVYDTGGHLLVGRERDARSVVSRFLAQVLNPAGHEVQTRTAPR